VNHWTRITAAGAILLAVLALPASLSATNGMYMVGYGAETVGRGGANLAISDRSMALNFNPAGLTQLQGTHITANLSVLAPQLEYLNFINDRIDGESNYFPLPALAYVRGSRDSRWTWGVGLLAQGGMGATFKGQNTFFGTVDRTSSEVAFMTLTPSVAYAVNDDMAFGLSANIGYGEASFSFFPETSFFNPLAPEFSFFGLDMDKASGSQLSARLGWWYRPHPRFSIGAIYQTRTESTWEGGDMTVNFEGHPFLGQRVKYDAEMDGFTFAAQAGVGFAYRATEELTLALDIKRYFWDDAIDTITVTATDPSFQFAPPEIVVPFVFDWEDQWVLALGFDYKLNDRWTVRAGYNHGENPVPDDTMNPLFPAIVEDHFAAGFGWLVGNKVIDFAVERAVGATATNNNLDPMVNPFGPLSTVEHSQWTVSFGISWALDRSAYDSGTE
jgi:long-chain fatty acid transport protein